jgi:hypothetical protein
MEYLGIRKRATGQINKSGKTVALRVPGIDTFNPETGTLTPGTAVDHSVKVVEIGYSQGQRDGTIVQINDRRFLVAGLKADGSVLPKPTTQHKLVISNLPLSIVSVSPIEPGDISVAYEVQCRG